MLAGMRPHLRLLALVIAAGVTLTGGHPAAAQQGNQLPAPPAPGSVRMHRTRAVATWKRYVWSLQRPLLAQVVADLEAELKKTGEPAEFTPALLLAHGYLMIERPAPAAESLLRAREIAPGHPGVLLVEALMTEAKSRRESVQMLDRYIERLAEGPEDRAFGAELEFLGYTHRGDQQLTRGNWDEAAQDLQRALEICRAADHEPPGPLVQRLARAHQALAEFGRAEELIREMMRRDPADPMNYLNLGVLYYEQDRFDDARRWYEAALARKPTLPEPHLRLAYLASVDRDLPRLRRHAETFERLARAEAGDRPIPHLLQLEVHAAYGSYWHARATRLRAEGADQAASSAYARARKELDAALRIEPNCLRALTLRVQIAAQTGEDEATLTELREQLDAVHSSDPDSPLPYRNVFC